MRTLTCYVPGGLREETVDALSAQSTRLHVTLVQIPKEDPYAYGHAIQKMWWAQEDFFIVEPDIVIRPDVADAALNCGCEYGCFPYAWLTDVGPALGCTWFKKSFLQKYPHAVDRIVGAITWKQFDCVLMRHILAREHGEQPHVHLPPVEHLNPEKQLLPEASPVPLMEVPHW